MKRRILLAPTFLMLALFSFTLMNVDLVVVLVDTPWIIK